MPPDTRFKAKRRPNSGEAAAMLSLEVSAPSPVGRSKETGADPILHVTVDVIVDVDDHAVHAHILLSIWTTRSRSERPSASSSGFASCRTLHASRIAAHSIAEPRAIA